MRAERHERDCSAVSIWQIGTSHRGGSMPMALLLMSGHAIGSRDMDMHHGYTLHESSERSGTRTVIPVFDILIQKLRAERSQQPPMSGRRSGESTNYWPTRLQHCAPLA